MWENARLDCFWRENRTESDRPILMKAVKEWVYYFDMTVVSVNDSLIADG